MSARKLGAVLEIEVGMKFSKFVVYVCTLQLIFPPSLFALEIELRSKKNARVTDSDGSLKRSLGVLPVGTRLEIDIPDDAQVADKGRLDKRQTLISWLEKTQREGDKVNGPGEYTYDSKRKAFFFPAKVISKNTNIPTGQTVMVNLADIRNLKDGLMVVDDSSYFKFTQSKEKQSPVTSSALPAKSAPSKPQVSCPHCLPEGSVLDMLKDLERPMAQLESEKNRDLSSGSALCGKGYSQLKENFQNSCGGNFDDFLKHLKEQASAHHVPPELLVSILAQESGGRCATRDAKGRLLSNIGLFQINLGSTKYKYEAGNKKKPLSVLSKVEILKNPITNLDEALRILDEKRNTLIRMGFDSTILNDTKNTDGWRLILLAYNGGEGWVMMAKNLLKKFNERYKTSYDPNIYENLRPFLLEAFLDSNQDSKYFGQNIPLLPKKARINSSSLYSRGKDSTMVNLAYAETILGRRSSRGEDEAALPNRSLFMICKEGTGANSGRSVATNN